MAFEASFGPGAEWATLASTIVQQAPGPAEDGFRQPKILHQVPKPPNGGSYWLRSFANALG
jgi:hypothetical protein